MLLGTWSVAGQPEVFLALQNAPFTRWQLFTAVVPFQAAFMCCTHLRPKPVKSEKLLCPLFLYFGSSHSAWGVVTFRGRIWAEASGFFPQEAKDLDSRVIALKDWGADFTSSCASPHWQDLCDSRCIENSDKTSPIGCKDVRICGRFHFPTPISGLRSINWRQLWRLENPMVGERDVILAGQ
jgi:hypothetical protein